MNHRRALLFALAPLLLLATESLGHARKPLVVVVHGIGGGNRARGWSRAIIDEWGVKAHEIAGKR